MARRTFQLRHGEGIEPLQRELEVMLGASDIRRNQVHELNLALGEWLENVLQHAGGAAAETRVDIECEVGGNEVVLRVSDDGKPFDPTQFPTGDVPSPSAFAPHGIALIRRLVDSLSYARRAGCNVVELRKSIIRGAPAQAHAAPAVFICAPRRLDGLNAGDFSIFAGNVIEAGARQVALDLTELDYISSAGIRALLILHKQLQACRGKLVLVGCSPHVTQVLHLSGLGNIMAIAESREAARRVLDESPSTAGRFR